MVTKLDIGDEVFVTGTVKEIKVDKDGVWYDIRIPNCDGVRTDTFLEDKIRLKKKNHEKTD